MTEKKGFSLAEMVAVIAIMMLLAALSTPFVKGYIDDAYNGKAQIYMRELNEARINFEKDYPGTVITGTISSYDNIPACNIEDIYGQNQLSLGIPILIACKYLRVPTDVIGRYEFSVGNEASCDACNVSVASMNGGENAGNYNGKCACIDSMGKICKKSEDGSNTIVCE